MKKLATLIGMTTVLVFAACSPTSTTVVTEEKRDWHDPADRRNVITNKVFLEGVVDYGQGVYYFPKTRAYFVNTLTGFLRSHTNLEVTAMTGDVVRQNRREDHQSYNYDVGYFVTFREKK